MSASDHLQPQLFHGTAITLQKGDKVLPAKKHGGHSTYAGMDTSGGRKVEERAFATSDENAAWTFADYGRSSRGRGRTSVLKVAPHPKQEMGLYDPEHPDTYGRYGGGIPGERVAKSFKVQERIDTRPGHQGTFPNLNWQQFSKQKSERGQLDIYNHPEDDQIEQGHDGGKMSQKSLSDLSKSWADPRAVQRAQNDRDNVGQGKLFDMEPVKPEKIEWL